MKKILLISLIAAAATALVAVVVVKKINKEIESIDICDSNAWDKGEMTIV